MISVTKFSAIFVKPNAFIAANITPDLSTDGILIFISVFVSLFPLISNGVFLH